MKGELTKHEGFRIQDSESRIFSLLDTGFYTYSNYYRNSTKLKWILDPSTKIANRIPGNPGKNYQNIAG